MTQSNEMTGGEALVRMILAHNGGNMFGMGGFQLLPFYDAARRLAWPTTSSMTSAVRFSRPMPMPRSVAV